MNYQPVVAGKQPNSSAGIQEHFDADPQNTDVDTTFEVKEPESAVHVSPSSSAKRKNHDDKTKREAKGKSHVELSIGVRNLSEEFEDFSSNSTNKVNAASTPVPAIEPSSNNNPNTFNADGPSNNVVTLEDITFSDNEEDVGAEADFSNLETNINGHTQEEGIDYEEVFTPVARIEAKRLFLAYASFMGFIVYQMDVISAFLYGIIKEEKISSTPMDNEKPLLKDPDGEDVDVHTYRYHKGKPYLGLWYLKDLPFHLVAYSDCDYAGASLDRKSTTGGCQFLGCRLISWQCKKQTVVATSSTEAEYVAAACCCAQVL
nr:uncharacterized mitochondrial protein AtMg00810-like [Tanacetum cinerariifolium]